MLFLVLPCRISRNERWDKKRRWESSCCETDHTAQEPSAEDYYIQIPPWLCADFALHIQELIRSVKESDDQRVREPISFVSRILSLETTLICLNCCFIIPEAKLQGFCSRHLYQSGFETLCCLFSHLLFAHHWYLIHLCPQLLLSYSRLLFVLSIFIYSMFSAAPEMIRWNTTNSYDPDDPW